MILGKDGQYYLDKELKVPITRNLINSINEKLIEISYKNNEKFTLIINGKYYNFIYRSNLLYFIDEDKNENLIYRSFVDIIFKVNKTEYRKEILTYKQFENYLKIFDISYYWSNGIYVSKAIITEFLYGLIKQENTLIIENIDFKTLVKPIVSEIKKYSDLSLYIEYYLKSNVDLDKYEEKDFLDKSFFDVDINSKFNWYNYNEKLDSYTHIDIYFQEGNKEYFFTGLHSIGKTFMLLGYNFRNNYKNDDKNDNKKSAYFNLEAYKNNTQFFKIIVYETQYLFANEKEWKDAFDELKDSILNCMNPLDIIIQLVKLLANKYMKKEIEYIFIIDQIKFAEIGDSEFLKINVLRKIVHEINNFYLIGCCSINYKGVKDILFQHWFKFDIGSINNIPRIFYATNLINDSKKVNNNKYLNILGNSPRFKNMQDKLNSKVVNLYKKKIKNKLKKFYNIKEFYELKKLENIHVGNIFNSLEDFKEELDKIPIKYFIINFLNKTYDFSCPIVKMAIEELLEEINLIIPLDEKGSELGWYFERRVIYTLKTTNILSDKYYIDNSYLIPTIFINYKVEGLDLKENSLFYFKYCNVRRYDAVLYIKEEKAFLFIQISINKEKTQFDKYNDKNFESDLDDVQDFIKINKLDVKKYYLLFILEENNYKKKENKNVIDNYDFKYYFYNLEEKKFKGELKGFYEIKNTVKITDEIKNHKIYEFGKINDTFIFDFNGTYHKYYAEKGMSMEIFFNEIIGEDLKNEFKNITHIDFSHFCLYSDNGSSDIIKYLTSQNIDLDSNNNVLLLNLESNDIYYGIGKPRTDLSWHKYNLITRENIKIKHYWSRCFLFNYKKYLYPK